MSNPTTSLSTTSDSISSLPIKASASLAYNNFTTNGSWACYVHLSEVHMISESSLNGKKQANIKKFQTKEGIPVMQAKWCKVLGKSFLVLALKNGVQVSIIYFTYSLSIIRSSIAKVLSHYVLFNSLQQTVVVVSLLMKPKMPHLF
jgi:hypothetical protein